MKVKNRLAVIMAEKEIRTISELQRMLEKNGTPVARRTLDRLYKNENNQILYRTIADLCQTLDVSIGELFILVDDEEESE